MTARFAKNGPLGVLAAVAAFCLGVGTASADRFGGFSADESRVLLDRDQVCQVQRLEAGKVRGSKSCNKLAADAVAKLAFRAGAEQAGPQAKVRASHRGSRIEVKGDEGLPSFALDILDPVVRIVSVHLSAGGQVVAVEYVVRATGRERAEVLAVSLAGGAGEAVIGGATAAAEPTPAAAGQAPTIAPAADADLGGKGEPTPTDKKVLEGLAKARKTFAKGGVKNASLAGKYVMAVAPKHPEGLYYLAVASGLAKRVEESLTILERMAGSGHPDLAIWRIEARFHKAFAALRDNPRYRAAVGLDAPARTLYEQLLGFGGSWEQAGTPCSDPTVKLEFQRIVPKFKLRIQSRCQGMNDTTRLSGTWEASPGGFALVLPNQEAADERITCAVVRCGEEDCVRCKIDSDLVLELASVRR